MLSIKEKAPKISDALQAMVDGIKTQTARPDFELYMFSFGDFNDNICYGCAATCAIQQIAGKNLTPENIRGVRCRSYALELDAKELCAFEEAISNFALGDGSLGLLSHFYNVPIPESIINEVKKWPRIDFSTKLEYSLQHTSKIIQALQEHGL